MIEHRLIERMIDVLAQELERLDSGGHVDAVFIDTVVDFIRTYADKTHHGKEEDILFRELEGKSLKPGHEKTMKELVQEHVEAREMTAALVRAKDAFLEGDRSALQAIKEKMAALVQFYPAHIEKEDKHFFKPVMKYFTKKEQDAMLEEGRTFDRRMIHRKYLSVTEQGENRVGKDPSRESNDWIEYM